MFLKQEKPEMDDFERKIRSSKEENAFKYFLNILRKY